MRTFISIELPKEVKDYLFDLEKTLKKELPAKINWIHKKNLHINLKFLGNIKESEIEIIKTNLKKIKFKPFELTLTEIGGFPSLDFIKVLWIGLEPENKLIDLQREIDEETMKYTNTTEFAAHLTLGRVKQVLKQNKEAFQNKVSNIKIKKLSFKIESFHLMKSILTKDGPKYFKLEEFK